jgi:hypothetical protein
VHTPGKGGYVAQRITYQFYSAKSATRTAYKIPGATRQPGRGRLCDFQLKLHSLGVPHHVDSGNFVN